MKLCALFILASASYVLGAVERYPPEEKPQEFAGQEGCYLKEANKVFPYDTRVNAEDGSCTQYFCSKSSGETQKFSCGAVLIEDGCETVIDLTKGYPECCPKEQCDPTTPAPTTAPTPATSSTSGASSTTPAPTTAPTPATSSTSGASSTTPAPTTAPTPATSSTSGASSTTPSPAAASGPVPGSYASAYAKSESGKPPVTQTFNTPGASASASAT